MINGVIERAKGKNICYRVGTHVVVNYPSTCVFSSFRVYELKPFLIDGFKLIDNNVIAYDKFGVELKTWDADSLLTIF